MSKKTNILCLASLLVLSSFASGCADEYSGGTETSAPVATNDAPTRDQQATKQDGAKPKVEPIQVGSKPMDGEEVAVFETEKGNIVIRFFPDRAPKHVENFKKLIKEGFYDGTKFHRTIPGFMIQGGDPNTKKGDPGSWGQGDPGYKIDAEFNEIDHQKGIVSMARSQDPNSAGSQFFIVVGDAKFLNNQYTAFGEVVQGIEAADKIVELPNAGEAEGNRALKPVTLKKASLQKWPVKK